MSSASPVLVIRGPVELKVILVEISSLHHHEELLPGLLEDLKEEIARDGYLKHPVIVDEETLVVIDGSHRVEALRELGCKLIPACMVRYQDPDISVGCWYRTLKGPLGLDEASKALEEGLGVEVRSSPGLRPEEVGEPPVAMALTDGRSYSSVVWDFSGIWEAWGLVKRAEGVLRELGFEVGFETEEDAFGKLSSGEADLVLMTPRVCKSDVLQVALSGRRFPHKTTRHKVPARPLFLNIPLEILRDHRPREDLEGEVRRLLASRRVRRLPPGEVIEGRRYEEEVYVLEP